MINIIQALTHCDKGWVSYPLALPVRSRVGRENAIDSRLQQHIEHRKSPHLVAELGSMMTGINRFDVELKVIDVGGLNNLAYSRLEYKATRTEEPKLNWNRPFVKFDMRWST